ncbi:complex III assembly factor LYRM7 [Brachionus plicatilis]|uniref:Complex III assembly factor LYRM7 n=1 Tax=Brachionus plicatilis TaxID=10195 RepID=A0A3M7RIF6_BRAPC|nr:complex III assembly factor LYRM7 [Brachionus plicatilis]
MRTSQKLKIKLLGLICISNRFCLISNIHLDYILIAIFEVFVQISQTDNQDAQVFSCFLRNNSNDSFVLKLLTYVSIKRVLSFRYLEKKNFGINFSILVLLKIKLQTLKIYFEDSTEILMSRLNLYSRVLNLYKSLYITSNRVFQDDNPVLKNSLTRLRNEFKANKHLADEAEIKQLLKFGREVKQELEGLIQTIPTEKQNIYTSTFLESSSKKIHDKG